MGYYETECQKPGYPRMQATGVMAIRGYWHGDWLIIGLKIMKLSDCFFPKHPGHHGCFRLWISSCHHRQFSTKQHLANWSVGGSSPKKSDGRLKDHQNGNWYSPNSAALPRFQNAYSVTIAGGGKSWRSWKSMEVSTIFFSLQSEKSIYRIRKKSSINHPAIGVAPLRKPQNMFNHWMLARLQLPLSGAQGAWEFWPRNGGELGVDQVRCRLR